ncbi:TIGR00282 family metallophosphoesterase [Anaerosinus massiliensis]|uniref:TIGR00282 family metallophosphoesterase n=1 Tax=Massilibacillus massiliensis TaxID=1806837 RepID=UPI000AF59308|nr:TIGR00282 family metallophosphoesterase [Massilibacillus massiliensis]
MNILMIGDIYGKIGRQAVTQYIPALKTKYQLNLIIANGENSAGGVGITKKTLDEIYNSGVDVVTSGNHIWDKKEIFQFIDHERYLIRPANYPPQTPGKGYCIFEVNNKKVGIANISGRTFMPALDCPFRKADEIIECLNQECDLILFDFHAETTSEKMAMGWYVDGRITCMVGTHTHIQTADERILPKGTAYITDLGMVGPWNSVLGVDRDLVIKKFLTGLPVKFDIASGPHVFCGLVIMIDDQTNQVQKVQRIMIREDEI